MSGGFNIAAFKANGLVYGGARPTMFNVYMTTPSILNIDQSSQQKFTFVCQAAELPESAMGNIPIYYFGRPVNQPGDREFGPWNVEVMNDEDFGVRSMFESWHNTINRLESNVRAGGVEDPDIKTDIEIRQYSRDGELIRSYQMIGAYPQIVGAIRLSWQAQNQIEIFPVSFRFDYWLPVVEQSSKKDGGVNVYGDDATSDN